MTVTPSDREKQLAQAALDKQRKGQKPRKEEARALDKVRAHAEEQKRWEFLKSTPKGHVCQMLGRQQKTVDEWGSRYAMPVLGRVVDVAALLGWLGNFLANNGRSGGSDEVPALDRLREEKILRERIKRHVDEKQYLPRPVIHETLTRFASILRSAGQLLEKKHGADARAILDEALDECDREIDSLAATLDQPPA